VAFDVLHYLFHKLIKSKYKLFRAFGALHKAHHHFYSYSLQINPQWAKKNIRNHLIIEYIVQVFVMLSCGWFLNPIAVCMAAGFETCLFIWICCKKGIDPHHKSYTTLPSARGSFFVGAEYHAQHHMYPLAYFSSYIKVVDFILGTGHQLKGKRIAMTGASGALGSAMKKCLEKEGAKVTSFKFGVDYDYQDYEKLRAPLSETDILLLCHGSKMEYAQEANCDSFVNIIELFKSARKRTLAPLEVWGVGSEIECHPCFGIKKLYPYANSKRAFARHAHQYFRDRDIQYRHIVHSAFISKMGPGLMTASFAARVTVFLIKRDFKYVPVTYTGFAFLNYFRFVFNV
jgi:hypothetical protein